MLKRGNPLGIEAVGQIVVNLDDAIEDIHNRINDAEEARATWIKKQRILVEQRRGLRTQKSIPWVGSNNDAVPLMDGIIRRWKPSIISLVWDADPVAYFKATKPEDIDPARASQDFYHWKFHTIPHVLEKVNVLTDYLGQYGIAYSRQGWKYRTGRSCRILRVAGLFPGGPVQATQVYNEGVRQMNAQIAQAVAAGQQPPMEQQPEHTPEQHVKHVLQLEYELDDSDIGKSGATMLDEAVVQIMGGAEYVKLYYETILEDRPDFAPISPLDVLEPPVTREDGDPDWYAIIHRCSRYDITHMVKDGVWRKEQAQIVLDRMDSRDNKSSDIDSMGFDGRARSDKEQIIDALRRVEGVDEQFSEQLPYSVVWEIYTKLDINGDGVCERVILWYHPETKTVLSILEFPLPFDAWPIVKFEYEKTSNRPYQARGIAEQLTVFQKLATQLHNSRLDSIQILLSPMLKVRAINNEMARNIKYRPGTIIPLQQVEDLQPLGMDLRPISLFLQEESVAKSGAEQHIGVFDQTVQQLGRQERRTATEVEAITAQISQVFSGDANLFQSSMAKVHTQLWDLWVEFGPDEEYYRVTGEERPRIIKKAEVAKKYDIFPAGTPANTNKALALARAREALQMFAADQTGLINKHALYKNYFDLLDRNFAKVVVRSEEEAAAMQQIVQAASSIAGGQVPTP